jgi:hypothetical protein
LEFLGHTEKLEHAHMMHKKLHTSYNTKTEPRLQQQVNLVRAQFGVVKSKRMDKKRMCTQGVTNSAKT